MMFQNTEKTNLLRKCTTSLIRRQNHNGEVVSKSWLCFSPLQTCAKCFTVGCCSRSPLEKNFPPEKICWKLFRTIGYS